MPGFRDRRPPSDSKRKIEKARGRFPGAGFLEFLRRWESIDDLPDVSNFGNVSVCQTEIFSEFPEMNENDLQDLNGLIDGLLDAHFDLEQHDRSTKRPDPRVRPGLKDRYDAKRTDLVLFVDGLWYEATRDGC